MNASDYQAAGLYDPDGENADGRLALLEFLAATGATLEQMIDADARGALASAAWNRQVLRRGELLSLREIATRADMTLTDADEAWRAVGLGGVDPDEKKFVEADIATFVNFQFASEVFGKEAILQFTRVGGSSMARIAEGGMATFVSDLERPLTEAQATELEIAQALQAGGLAAASVPTALETFFWHHWQAAIERFQTARVGVAGFDSLRLAVGFVDLVGFTPLALQLAGQELSRTIADFEARAFDCATSRDGRIVKLIGDEVMFTALDAPSACDIALTLFETLGEHRAVTPRGGLAIGELITRAGDYYGPVVNLASRIGDQAVPDEILVSTDVRSEVVKADARGYHFDPAGRRMLKGFDEPVEVFSLTRAG
ncbi:MAG: adenylate/guanylate cyclase domain-containing protein [Actinomycetota bacterium]